ncbi:MAG: glycosyltransferase family 4 protein [Actinomycetota bacterium]
MRIAYVCADRGFSFLGFSGQSLHLREMASALSAIGHDVSVFCDRVGKGNELPPVRSIDALPKDRVEQQAALHFGFQHQGIDAVLERYSLESGVAASVAARLGLPYVLEVHSPLVMEAARYRGYTDVEAGLNRERALFRSAHAIVVSSSWLGEYVQQKAPDAQVEVVHSGVDLARFKHAHPVYLGLPPDTVTIGFVGGMKLWHGVLDLMEAFAYVCERDRRTHLVLAGEGPQDDLVRSRAAKPDLRGRVSLLGAVPHDRVPSVLAAFDIAVAPYRPSDCFYFSPVKIMEYLAAGAPVVYPEVEDLTSIVGGAGMPYSPGNIRAMAQALEKLSSDAALRQRLQRQAGLQSRQFESSRAAEKIVSLLRPASSHANEAS